MEVSTRALSLATEKEEQIKSKDNAMGIYNT
jgi:hypothetical protein